MMICPYLLVEAMLLLNNKGAIQTPRETTEGGVDGSKEEKGDRLQNLKKKKVKIKHSQES